MSAHLTPSRMDEAAWAGLEDLRRRIVSCRTCPRLVSWREEAARSAAALRTGAPYWARPLPGFGDPAARLLLVGLAPAAHGGNRTGRMFTGDRSGDFLFAALHRAGYANVPLSISADDTLVLRDAFVTAAVRCAPPANKPSPEERRACAGYLASELELLEHVRVVIALGAFAYDSLLRQLAITGGLGADGREAGRAPRFAHGLEVRLGPATPGRAARVLLCSYHPSQRNVFTGLLTPAMFDAVLRRARLLTGAGTGPEPEAGQDAAANGAARTGSGARLGSGARRRVRPQAGP